MPGKPASHVYRHTTMNPTAKIVDGATQNGKTAKVFEELGKGTVAGSDTICLFVTQANSVTAVHQIVGRARQDARIRAVYDVIMSVTEFKESEFDHEFGSNVLVAGFWNSRTIDIMFDALDSYGWRQVIVVVDECDSGGVHGVLSRLNFVRRVEKRVRNIQVIFVTATVANLSGAVLSIGGDAKYASGVVHDIVFEQCVQHFYVVNKDDYVGASWFVNKNPKLLHMIPKVLRRSDEDMADFNIRKRNVALKKLKKLEDAQKEFVLVVISNRKDEHRKIAKKMLETYGFNVTVMMNSERQKNYEVFYVGDDGEVKTWMIPYTKIEALADKGEMKQYRRKKNVGFEGKFDVTISYVLQAALFMDTEAEERIQENVAPDEFMKLKALNDVMTSTASVGLGNARPWDWPDVPRVGLIAGAIAGRGNTFQNQMIDLACTAFMFTGTADTKQRGALNAQRFGRACGLLGDIFVNQGRRPVLFATEVVLRDALANEVVLREKAEGLEDGEMIALKDLVSKDEWVKVLKKTQKRLENLAIEKAPRIRFIEVDDAERERDAEKGVEEQTIAQQLLKEYLKISENGKNTFTYEDIHANAVAHKIHATDHHRSHKKLISDGFIADSGDKTFTVTSKAIE
jgi:hypothetical protein